MKHLFLALSILIFTATIEARAQEPASRPYEEMSYQELLALETGSLTKAQKKAHKKALSRAKKIERARLRDLEKRRKAEARARAKRNKAIAKKLKKVAKYRDNTRLSVDEFSTQGHISGPWLNPRFDWNQLFYGSKDLPEYMLFATAYRESENRAIGLEVSINNRIEGLSLPSLQMLDILPEEYADLKNLWPDFNQALMPGGETRPIVSTHRQTNGCTIEECFFQMRFAVELQISDVKRALAQRGPLSIKLVQNDGRFHVIRVRYEYLLGFAWRLSELDSRYSDFAEIAEEGRNHIIETTR